MKVEYHTQVVDHPIVVRMTRTEFKVVKQAIEYGVEWMRENGYSTEEAAFRKIHQIIKQEPEINGTLFVEDDEPSKEPESKPADYKSMTVADMDMETIDTTLSFENGRFYVHKSKINQAPVKVDVTKQMAETISKLIRRRIGL